MLSKFTLFKSDRLNFKGIDAGDCEKISCWRNALPRNCFCATPEHLTLQSQLDWYHNSYLNDDSRIDFLIIERKENCSIGVVGVKGLNYAGHKCEVSYMIGEPTARGKGYAVESVSSLCALLFENGIYVIKAHIHKENIASKAIVIKNGFYLIDELADGYELYERRV